MIWGQKLISIAGVQMALCHGEGVKECPRKRVRLGVYFLFGLKVGARLGLWP